MSDDTRSLSNAHQAPPIPEGLARGVSLLLEKRLSSAGLQFDCKAYIDEHGKACVQVYVDNGEDPNDFLDLHYEVDDDTPDELYAIVREDLSEIYEL
jgi:hypothetical protein